MDSGMMDTGCCVALNGQCQRGDDWMMGHRQCPLHLLTALPMRMATVGYATDTAGRIVPRFICTRNPVEDGRMPAFAIIITY
jgi:hypothetical protein